MISILNIGFGNLGSLKNMINKLGGETEFVSTSNQLKNVKKLIIPGVGSFDNAMTKLRKISQLEEKLRLKAFQEKIPILGICLGMQLLVNFSQEGKSKGLSFIDGEVLKFPISHNLKVPHMGWNTVKIKNKNFLVENLNNNSRFYFVHSYYVKPKYNKNILMTSKYNLEFASAIFNENIYGVQFHPEKSHKFGKELLKNFLEV